MKNKRFEMHYEGVSSLLDDIDEIRHKVKHKDESHLEEDWFVRFSGAKNYKEAKQFAEYGKDLENLSKTQREISYTQGSTRIQPCLDVAGGSVDVGRYLMGMPDCMWDYPLVDEERKHMKLYINVGEISSTTAQQMENKGSAIASVIDMLEQNDYRVKLLAFCSVRCNSDNKDLFFSVTLKDYDDHVSLTEVSGCLQPAFFRRIVFRFIEQYAPNTTWSAYGHPCKRHECEDYLKDHSSDEPFVYIPPISDGDFGRFNNEKETQWGYEQMLSKVQNFTPELA